MKEYISKIEKKKKDLWNLRFTKLRFYGNYLFIYDYWKHQRENYLRIFKIAPIAQTSSGGHPKDISKTSNGSLWCMNKNV